MLSDSNGRSGWRTLLRNKWGTLSRNTGVLSSEYLEIKKSDHAILACLLQGIESQVLIEDVIQEFWKESPDTPVFTIHDSAVVPYDKSEDMERCMGEFIKKKVGYQPALLSEIYKL